MVSNSGGTPERQCAGRTDSLEPDNLVNSDTAGQGSLTTCWPAGLIHANETGDGILDGRTSEPERVPMTGSVKMSGQNCQPKE